MSEIIINAAEAMALLKKHYFRGIKEMVAAAPELVRCRDCEYFRLFTDGIRDCSRTDALQGAMPDDYCSYGVRRDDGKVD